MKTRNRTLLALLLILALILPLLPTISNHVHAWGDWEECAFCGKSRSPDWLCDTCGGCNDNTPDCYEDHHCPDCGACLEEISHCGGCLTCYECAGILCHDCGGCSNCAGTICESCQTCLGCVGFDEICSSCEKCVNCMGMGFCQDCDLCGDCTEMCSNDGCTFCESCMDLCDNCGQCELCVYGLFCDNCGLCGDCFEKPLCTGCNYCSDCAIVCVNCEQNCDQCSTVCESCERCEDCIGETLCPTCHECTDCSGELQCESCDQCSQCITICDDCGVICDECAPFCQDCTKCNSCVHLCHDCGDYCFDCKDHCHDCDSCEECVNLCENCNEVCDYCVDFCLDCNSCTNCVNLCDSCGELCDSCTFLCEDCNKCSNCVTLCDDCNRICADCADFCVECNKCSDCVNLCSNCNKNCDNCLEFCKACNTCSDCSYTCPSCEVQCTMCEVDWEDRSLDDFSHQRYCICGGPVGKPEGHNYKYEIVKEATQTTPGIGQLICISCNHYERFEIPATGGEEHVHDYSIWVTNASFHRRYCSCGKAGPEGQKRHEFIWIIDKDASIGNTGLKHLECIVCGYQLQSEVIPAIEHTHIYESKWSWDSDYHWHACSCGHWGSKDLHSFADWIIIQAATEAIEGIKERNCNVCDYKETISIPKIVLHPPKILTENLIQGVVNITYSESLNASGSKPITWSIVDGKLPNGLFLNEITGEIKGKPTEAGTFTILIKAENAIDNFTASLKIIIAAEPVTKYKVTVNNGIGNGEYLENETVSIIANSAPTGKVFDQWVVKLGSVTLQNKITSTTTFIMPAYDVTVEATYKNQIVVEDSSDLGSSDLGSSDLGSNDLGSSDESSSIGEPNIEEIIDLKIPAASPKMKFIDVKESDWFYKGVKYVNEKGVMVGTSDKLFSPNTNTSRAMILLTLHNLEGKPEIVGNYFTDVLPGIWYKDCITWAANNSIVKGYGNGLFGPEDDITREQLITILYNYAKFKGYNTSYTKSLVDFADNMQISDWARDKMAWAVESGLIYGRTKDLIGPRHTATRGEVATILERFIEILVK